ncbi:MAG: ABC transporter permease [Bacteroidetes bacterium]|nr:MAG: ABC transporter permease [Bacteroidota bacterium]
MKQLRAFIAKEFYHVFRDHKTLLLLFGLPIVQIILFGFALSTEVKNSNIAILDRSKDDASREIIHKIASSDYFEIERNIRGHEEILEAFQSGKVRAVVIFEPDFSEHLLRENKAQLQIIADASDVNTATTINNYLTNIVTEYQRELLGATSMPWVIEPEIKMLYNPQLKGEYTFIPGIMAMIMLLVGVMMTSISIVREKELGTMEILLVSPFKPLWIVLAKFAPYVIISILNVTAILLLSYFFLELPVKGSLFLLYVESLLFILTSLSLGLLISVLSKTQQTAMFISLMATMLPTLLLSGFMFPIENMPMPLQVISNIVPSKWFFIIVKSIMIKGLGIEAVWKETLILAGMTLLLFVISLRKFKIRLE